MFSFGILLGLAAYSLSILLPVAAICTLLFRELEADERLMIAIPVTLSIVPLAGTMLSRLGVGFDYYTVGFAILVVFALIMYRFRGRLRSAVKEVKPSPERLIKAAVVLLPCLVSLYSIQSGFGAFVLPPHNDDASAHVYLIDTIHQLGQIDNNYPSGFHSNVALLLDVLPIPSYRLAFYLAWIIAALLPASIYFMVKLFFRDFRLAVLSSYASMSFYLVPVSPFNWGGWAMLSGLLMLPFFVSITYRAVDKGGGSLILLSGFLAAGIYIFHPTELITAAVALTCILAVRLGANRKNLDSLAKRLALVFVAALVFSMPALNIFHFLSGRVSQLVGSGSMAGLYTPPAESERQSLIARAIENVRKMDYPGFTNLVVGSYGFGVNKNTFLGLAYALGILAIIAYKRGYLPVILIQIVFFLIFFDSAITKILELAYSLFFPWGQMERLFYNQYYFISVIAGVGLLTVLETVTKLVSKVVHNKKGIVRISAVGMGVLILWGSYTPLQVGIGNMRNILYACAPASEDDVLAMEWIRDNTPANAVVLNDELTDAGAWVRVVAQRKSIFTTGDHTPEDYYLVLNIYKIGSDPNVIAIMKSKNISYVFFGSRNIPERPHFMSLPFLRTDWHFQTVYNSGNAFVFKYCEDGCNSSWGSMTPDTLIDVGSLSDEKYIHEEGWYPRENKWGSVKANFRWTSGTVNVTITPRNTPRIKVGLFAVGSVPCNISINGLFAGSVLLHETAYFREYQTVVENKFDGPGKSGLSCPTFRPPSDPRDLGIAVDKITLEYLD